VDSLELQLLGAVQRYQRLQQRVDMRAKDPSVTSHTIAELGRALELVRVAHEQIIEHRRRIEALQADLTAQRTRYWELFDEMPEPSLVTRPDTTILEVNQAAAALLNVSQRFLAGKTLSIFVCEDRGRLLDESTRIARECITAEWRVKLRPRECAPLTVSVHVRGDGACLKWTVTPPVASPAESRLAVAARRSGGHGNSAR
jgi:PAS domain-containing protein